MCFLTWQGINPLLFITPASLSLSLVFSTARTHLDSLTSLRRLWPEIAAVGSLHSPGLHFYDVSTGRHLGSLHWSDPDDPRIYKARVTAIAADSDPSLPLFAAFECPHRENCIMSVDRTTLKTAAELGRQNGGSIRVAPATKLAHLAATGLVFASAVSLGAFGYSGYMKLWTGANEPGAGRSSRFGDSFADANVDAGRGGGRGGGLVAAGAGRGGGRGGGEEEIQEEHGGQGGGCEEGEDKDDGGRGGCEEGEDKDDGERGEWVEVAVDVGSGRRKRERERGGEG